MSTGEMQEGSQWKKSNLERCLDMWLLNISKLLNLKALDKIVLRCDGTKGTTGKGEYIFTYILSITRDYTGITLTGEIKGLTGITKLLGKLMGGIFKKASAKDLDSLIAFLEK